jgi:hypothetical protein
MTMENLEIHAAETVGAALRRELGPGMPRTIAKKALAHEPHELPRKSF